MLPLIKNHIRILLAKKGKLLLLLDHLAGDPVYPGDVRQHVRQF